MSTAIVTGVGPVQGLGAQLGRRFAQLGLDVIVAGRTEAKLEELAVLINSEGGRAHVMVADATDEEQTIKLFDKAETIGPLELAIYNVGNATPGRIVDMEADYFLRAWQSGCFGGFLFGREAARRMLESKQGSILFTGASASLRGKVNYGAFNSAKSALRTFAQALAKEVGPEGIHVGHVIIDGGISGEKIQKEAPDYFDKMGEESLLKLNGIVDAYEYLHKQKKSAWSFELDLRTAVENW
ncbi:MAG: SDR family NAD(P)-dependent oxidoreductase [Gammaproteobacteria bacterium]|nr:SDR family NAD(P)-dependent oxidoreductase [Gammaproteobacteria bacterium]